MASLTEGVYMMGARGELYIQGVEGAVQLVVYQINAHAAHFNEYREWGGPHIVTDKVK